MSKIVRVAIYTCDRCHEEIAAPAKDSFTTGYGEMPNGDKHCFPCCADLDREHMIADGKITLYLTQSEDSDYLGTQDLRDYARLLNSHIYPQMSRKCHYVTNWPGSLRFKVVGGPGQGYHNMARYRYDVWFIGPDRHIWHGTQYGDNTQLCHCKRTKEVYADYIR